MPRSAWLAVGIAGGALAWQAAGAPGLLLVAAVGAGLAALGIARPAAAFRSGISSPVAIGAILLVARIALGGGLTTAGSGTAPVVLPAGSGPWIAEVVSIGTPRRGQQIATLRLEAVSAPLVTATLPRYPAIAPGDRLRVTGSIRGPRDAADADWLARSGAVGSLTARDMSLVPSTGGLGALLEHVRRAAGDGLTKVLPEPAAGLAAGILIGLRDRVDRDVAAAFTTAGVSHVVAISGWNIAIVAGVVAAVLGRVPRRRRSVAVVGAIVAYTLVAGASPSVVRAALMAGVVLLARESGRATRAAAALGWAATIMLLAQPDVVSDVGFQLSTAATAGLLAWGSGLTRWLDVVGQSRLPHWLSESLGVSLAAQAATLPIVLLAFGRLAIVAPLVNLAVVPLVPPVMATGAVALVAGAVAHVAHIGGQVAPIVGAMAAVLALPAWALLTAMIAIVDVGASLPLASVTLDPPVGFAGALGCAILLAGWGRRSSRVALGAALRKAWTRRPRPVARIPRAKFERRATGSGGVRRRPAALLVGAIAVALAGLVLAAAARPDGQVHLIVLDVGQGDAILVESERGGRLLVDGGPDPDALVRALDARFPPWDRRLDVVVLTHPHEDHVGGLPLLVARYRIGRIFEPGMRGPGPAYRAWQAALTAAGRQSEPLATGDHLLLDGVAFSTLWPDAGTVASEPPDSGSGMNDVSIVLLGEVAGRRFLLTGDAEDTVDPQLIARGLPRIDLLKVAHHGSRTATSAALLDALRPSVAIVSVGAGNTFGHPSPDTLERMRAAGARTFRTDRDGTVEATIGADGSLAVVAAGSNGRPTPAPSPTAAAGPRHGGPRAVEPGPLPATMLTAVARRRPTDPTPAVAGGMRGVRPLYHRSDVRPGAHRRSRSPPLARPADVAPPPLSGGRRGRGMARGTPRGRRTTCRSRARRSGGAPA